MWKRLKHLLESSHIYEVQSTSLLFALRDDPLYAEGVWLTAARRRFREQYVQNYQAKFVPDVCRDIEVRG